MLNMIGKIEFKFTRYGSPILEVCNIPFKNYAESIVIIRVINEIIPFMSYSSIRRIN